MVAPRTVKVGDQLWDVHRYNAGNIKGLTRLGCWSVVITEIVGDDPEVPGWYCMARWNGNKPKRFNRAAIKKLRRSPPKGY